MATNLNVSELDFDKIQTNLKTHLQAQTEFQDYNFDGSNLAGGIYYYTLTTNGKRSTKKFAVAK